MYLDCSKSCPSAAAELRRLAAGRVVLDVGGHYGQSALTMASAGAAHVVVVEPQSSAVDMIMAHLQVNPELDGLITVEQAALSARDEEVLFMNTGDVSARSAAVVDVNATAWPELLKRFPVLQRLNEFALGEGFGAEEVDAVIDIEVAALAWGMHRTGAAFFIQERAVLVLAHVSRPEVAEAPWSAAEWTVAPLFVELLQAQPGRRRT